MPSLKKLICKRTLRQVFPSYYTVIRFEWVIDKFGTCIVVSVNGALIEDKMRRFKGEFAHFSFDKCPIYTHDGASAKFSTNSQETDNSVPHTPTPAHCMCTCIQHTYLHGRGEGEGELTREKARGATVHNAGLKIPTCLNVSPVYKL